MAVNVNNPSGGAASDSSVEALADLASTGVLVRKDATSVGVVARTLTGTTNEIAIANGDGVSGNPTISLPTAITLTGKVVTGGTFTDPSLSGTVAGSPTLSGSPTITGGTLTISSSATPRIKLFETSADLDEKNWRIRATGGAFEIRPYADDDTTSGTAVLRANRVGNTIDLITLSATLIQLNGTVSSNSTGTNWKIGAWTSSNTDVDGLISGTAFGSLFEGQQSGHFTLGLRENDVNDGFQIISGGGNWATDSLYDTLLFEVKSNGPAYLSSTLDLGHASDTTISRLSAGQLAVEGVQVATASNAITLSGKTLSAPTVSGTIAGSPTASGTWTFANPISGATPVATTDLATKAYVDSVAVGLSVKTAVAAASTANVVSLSGTTTIDGVALIANDRVLLKDQTTTSQNGVYVIAAGAWSRATDLDVWSEAIGAMIPVTAGTVNANRIYVSTAAAGGTIGSTALTFTLFISTSGLQPLDSDLTSIAALTTTSYGRSVLTLADASASQTYFGLVIGTNVQAFSSVLQATTASFLAADRTKLDGIAASADVTGTANVTAAGAIMDGDFTTNGMMARTASGTYASRTVTGSTGISVADGDGAAGNPTLSLNARLVDVAGLTPTDNGVIVGNGTNFVVESGTTLRTSIGLAIGTDVMGYDADLATWAGVTPAANMAAWIADPTSAKLKATVTDETGSGALVFANTPTLVTPVLGVATATSINGTTIPTSTSLLTPSDIGSSVQAFDSDLAALAANTTSGLLTKTGAGAVAARTITGTTNEISVANGSGVSGNPAISLPSTIALTGKIVTITPTGGTISDALADWLDLLSQGIINIKSAEYGAVGDGVTDDTTAISAAKVAAIAAGKALYGPPGTYLTQPQTCSGALYILGAGPEATIFKLINSATAVGNKKYVFKFTTSNSGFNNCALDFNRTNQGQAAFNAATGSSALVYVGLYVEGTSGTHIENISCYGKVMNSADWGIYTVYADKVKVKGAYILNCGAGILIKDFDTADVDGLLMEGIDNLNWLITPNAINFGDGYDARCDNLNIVDHAGYKKYTTTTGETQSDWFQGVGVINVVGFKGSNWNVVAKSDTTMTKSVGISLLNVKTADISGVTCRRFTSVALEMGGCRDVKVSGDVLDGEYQIPDATLWPTERGSGIHTHNAGLTAQRARELTPNINCEVRFRSVSGFLGPGVKTFIADGTRFQDTTFEGNLCGVMQESRTANDSFTGETQATEDEQFNNCDFVNNEGPGFWDKGGVDTVAVNCRADNNGQARNHATPGTTRGGVDTITSTMAAGYYAADGATVVARTRPKWLQSRTQDSQMSLKSAVALATTANITLSGEQTIDGTLTSASRVLVKNQTSPAQNGIYVSAAGAWARATDLDSWDETTGAIIPVTGGTLSAGIYYSCVASVSGVIGTNNLTFAVYYGIGSAAPASGGGNPRVVYVRNGAKYRKGQYIKLIGCGAASADLKAYIVSITGDALTISTDIITFPIVTHAGTLAASALGTTLTGTTTTFQTATSVIKRILSPMFLKNGTEYRLIDRATSDTAAKLTLGFTGALSGAAVDLVQFNIVTMRSQNYGLVTNGASNDSTLLCDGHDFGVGNAIDNTSQAAPIEICLAQWKTPIIMRPQDFSVLNGTPVIGLNSASTRMLWLFDAASTERIGTQIRIPRGVTGKVIPVLYQINSGAGAGDVCWRYGYHFAADGGATETAATFVNFSTITAAAQNVSKVVRGTAFSVVADTILHFSIDREGGNVADTLGNDAGLFMVGLEVA